MTDAIDTVIATRRERLADADATVKRLEAELADALDHKDVAHFNLNQALAQKNLGVTKL